MRILVVEDEPRLNELIVKQLNAMHYSVDACLRGDDALDYISGAEYDVIVLDIMLPGISGLDILRTLRAQNNSALILLLTARDSIGDRVIGLNAGADDYLIKPFAFDELLARIRALLRRKSQAATNVLMAANLTVDCDTHIVTRDDKVIQLSGKEFAILEYLIRNKGLVLSRNKISDHIWNYDYVGSSNIIDVYIRNLRKKIDDGFEPQLIHTVRGVGYSLRAQE
ncbi:MAG TPA: response regulator transcription factor [Clostridia bacterium]|nr:response regulator transcription factor [Clostridia bacterium]